PLLVREVDRLERDGKVEPCIRDGAQDLQRCDHPERAVVAAAVRYRVEMRPEEDRPVAAPEERGVVPGGVDGRVEPGVAGALEEPAPRLEVRGPERGAVHAAARRRAD